MKVLIFGATGTVGSGVLRQCLLAPEVEEVLAVTRRRTGVTHPRLRELRHDDFMDYSAIADRLTGYDACFWCLGRTNRGLDDEAYIRVTYDFAVAGARTLASLEPDLRFFYVSAIGANAEAKARGARVKGRTENAILALFPDTGRVLRPAHVQPMDVSTIGRYSLGYRIAARLFPLLDRAFPRYVTTAERIGRVMVNAACAGFPHRVIAGRDLR
jgi:uncharacterized protein YbjT (DUF2867 family)